MEPGCQPDTASVASGRGQKPWAERGDAAAAETAEVSGRGITAAPKRQGALANSQHAVPPMPAGSDMEVSQEESLPSSVAQATDDVRGAGESDAGCDSGSLSPSSSLQFGDSETGSSSEDNAATTTTTAAAASAAAATNAANDNGGDAASRLPAASRRGGDDEDPTAPGRGSPSESSGSHRRPRRSRSESDPSAVASKKNRASGSPGKKVWLRRGPCQAQSNNAAGVGGTGGVGGSGGGGGSGVGKRRSQQQKERLRELRRKREAAVQRKLASLPYSSSSSSSSSCSSSSSSTSRSSAGSDSDARGRVLSPAQPPLDGPPVVVYNDLSGSDSGVGKLAKKEARVASAGGEAGDQGSLALGMSTLGQDLGK